MIFVDSNLPMYIVGADPVFKAAAQRPVEAQAEARRRLVTDAEVLQEILHRYVSIGRPQAIQPAFDMLLAVVDEVFPVTAGDVGRAKEVVLERSGLSARDALHLAVMERHRVSTILSFDRGFDGLPGITRLS